MTTRSFKGESAHLEQVPQVNGQVSSTPSNLQRFVLSLTQTHVLLLFLPLVLTRKELGKSLQEPNLEVVGEVVGDLDGYSEGEIVENVIGEGSLDGFRLNFPDGAEVGAEDGAEVGAEDKMRVGEILGISEGALFGTVLGCSLGSLDGAKEGVKVGSED